MGDCEAGNAEAASESDDEDVDTPAEEWSLAKTALLRPCPANIPADLKRGDRIVVWFGAPFGAWYVGVVERVDRRCQLPVVAQFEDGPSHLSLDAGLYGVTGGNMWALLQPNSPPLQPGLGNAAAGPSGGSPVGDQVNQVSEDDDDDNEESDDSD